MPECSSFKDLFTTHDTSLETMSLYNYSDVIPLSGRRPVWGSEVSVVSNSTVHTSRLFILCSDGLINGYEHTFDFLNQIVRPCVFILFSLKSKSFTCARARESNKRRNMCVRSLACMGVNLGMNSMNRRRKRINKSNKYSILKGEQKV